MPVCLYLCDGSVAYCTKESCYKTGGPCHYTKDEKYAQQQKPIEERIFQETPDGTLWEVDMSGFSYPE